MSDGHWSISRGVGGSRGNGARKFCISSWCVANGGLADFINIKLIKLVVQIPIIAIVLSSSRQKPIHRWKLKTYKHQNVGGITACKVTLAFRNCQPMILREFVKQSLGHIIKYSKCSRAASPDCPDTYCGNQLLDLNHLEWEIVYQTHWSCTGWGQRVLMVEELSDAMDIPSWCPWSNMINVPSKICLEVLQIFLTQISSPLGRGLRKIPKQLATKSPQVTWLSLLNKIYRDHGLSQNLSHQKRQRLKGPALNPVFGIVASPWWWILGLHFWISFAG